MTSNQVFENCECEKSQWKITHIVTTQFIILAQNQHSIFILHYFNAKLPGKYFLDPINFQNKLTWPNSNTAGISLDSRLKYSEITHRYAKVSPFTWFLYWKLPIDTDFSHFICQFHQFCSINARECFERPAALQQRRAGSFDSLMTSLFRITMDNGRGHCAYWQYCNVPNQTHRGMKSNWKTYAINKLRSLQNNRDMPPRPRLDLSGAPGLRPFGLSPGSGQTSLAWVACPGILHRCTALYSRTKITTSVQCTVFSSIKIQFWKWILNLLPKQHQWLLLLTWINFNPSMDK